MRYNAGQEVLVTTVVLRRPPGAAPVDSERLTQRVLAGVYEASLQPRTEWGRRPVKPAWRPNWLYLALSAGCLVGAVWAVYMAVTSV